MENTVENNRLIAEFMGYKITGSDQDFTFFEHPDGKGIIIQSDYDFEKFNSHPMLEARSMIFHRDWNWLMQVVEKIENLGHRVEIVKHVCRIGDHFLTSENLSKIKSTYTTVVAFIKWYNDNK